ncbi:MAG: Bax inhibitor-1/YccA family protein [Cyclobacteriaceae bacterium]|nr:Bax inhibitor-1/YccA family protein [Cyclobacteriaceae bacterium]
MSANPIFINQSTPYSFNAFLKNVFIWMGIGMAITAFVSYLFASNLSLLSYLITNTGISTIGYIVMFAPIGFVMLMSLGFNRLSYFTLMSLFLVYAAIMGASLSFIFLIYTSQSIFNIFIIATLMFGAMGVYGYSTKADLTKMSSLLLMALTGIIIASLINMFLKSDSFSYIISFVSVIVFCGLTAWDIQKLKRLNEDAAMDSETKSKMGILGALTLYLDFINLFLSLLRLFGDRRNS